MATYEYNDKVKFILPDDFSFAIEEDDEGDEICKIFMGEHEDEDGDTAYRFYCQIIDVEAPNNKTKAGEIFDEIAENQENAKFFRVPGTPYSMFFTSGQALNFLGHIVKQFFLTCSVIFNKGRVLNIASMGYLDEDDASANLEIYGNMLTVAKSIRVGGKKLPLDGITAQFLESTLSPVFDDSEAIDLGASIKLNVTNGDETTTYEYTPGGLKEVKKEKFRSVNPDKKLYPHYASIKNNIFSFLPGFAVNSTGTEFKFETFISMLNTSGLDLDLEEMKPLLQKVYDMNPPRYTLADTAKGMIKLFRVDQDVFNEEHDRENELIFGFMRRAYMMSALRSFAWTLADYCEEYGVTPETIDPAVPARIADFVASRDWLNYDGKTHCKGLCSGSDLHVYFIPDAVSAADRRKFLPSKEVKEEAKKMEEEIPGYNAILCEVHSLEALRKDLEYIYPAVKILYDDLANERDTSEALEGNAADIVYAWIAVAKAAEGPFFTEDGPVNYSFNWPGDWDFDEETANGDKNAEEWLQEYGKYAEKDPDIDFNGKLFVFTGLLQESTKDNPLVQRVIEKGGQYRSRISGLTDYLIVDPRGAGYSKIDAVFEQQKKGKKIKVILLEDLERILSGEPAPPKASASSKSKAEKSSKPLTKAAPKKAAATAAPKATKVTKSDCEISSGKLIKYNGRAKDIILPDGISVIGGDAFHGNGDITSVVIPEGVKTIEPYTFNNCSNLENVTLPDSLREIGAGAFGGTALTSVVIPEGVEMIGSRAFWMCKNLENVILPDSLREIGNEVFYSTPLTSIVIPDGCEEIGVECFSFCGSLKDIYVPESVCDIRKDAFCTFNSAMVIHTKRGSRAEEYAMDNDIDYDYDYPSVSSKSTAANNSKPLTKAAPKKAAATAAPEATKIPRSDCEISSDMLIKYNGSAKDIILPDGISIINIAAFKFNENITSVVIPEGVECISGGAFSCCSNLKSVTLPSTLRQIKVSAFFDTALTSIVIPEGIETIEAHVFSYCDRLESVTLPDTLREIGLTSFYNTALKSIVIPEKCERIGEECFGSCEKLKDIYVPRSVRNIGNDAFDITAVIHTEEGSFAERYARENGIKYDYDYSKAKGAKSSKPLTKTAPKKTAPQKAAATAAPKATKVPKSDCRISSGKLTGYNGSAKNIILPDGISAIGENAFLSNKSIISVVIPEGVETIEHDAFHNCPNLERVTLSGTIRKIDKSAFWGAALTSIVIPDGCEEIGKNCFAFCESLKDIYVPGSVCDIGEDAFYTRNDAMVIHTEVGSCAEEYAMDNDIDYEYDYLSVSSKSTAAESSKPLTKTASPQAGTAYPQQVRPEKKEGCYIATAVYGSYDAPEVMTLRRFRDETLKNSAFGRWFIRTYYRLSPPVAEKLKNARRVNAFVRSILDKWVERLNNKQH